MPFLSEIRRRFLFVFSIFLVAWVIGFIYYQPIVLFVLNLYDLSGVNIAFTSPFQFLNLALNSGTAVGALVVVPLVIFQLTLFLKPALHPKEYKLLMSLVPFSLVLFVMGFSFGSWMMKFVIKVFSQQTSGLEIQNLWDINQFFSQIFLTSVLLGLSFQFPLVLTFLIRLGIIKQEALVKFRLPAHCILLGVAIFMPPTDVFSLALMFLPLAIIYELTLFFNRKQKGN